jgi:hypothetical protein
VAPRARYRQNTKAFAKVLVSKQMQDAMKDRAEQVQQRAEGIAPRDTGDYGSSFRVEVGVREGPKPRAVAKVVNDNPAAPYVEWGTSRTPRYRVMGRAAGGA